MGMSQTLCNDQHSQVMKCFCCNNQMFTETITFFKYLGFDSEAILGIDSAKAMAAEFAKAVLAKMAESVR